MVMIINCVRALMPRNLYVTVHEPRLWSRVLCSFSDSVNIASKLSRRSSAGKDRHMICQFRTIPGHSLNVSKQWCTCPEIGAKEYPLYVNT